MHLVHILVEGQTEDIIVEQVLAPSASPGVWLKPILLKTKRPAGGGHHKGGVSVWRKVEDDIRRLLNDPHATYVTTLLDYYGLPLDTPGLSTQPRGNPYERVAHVESAMAAAIQDRRFVPNLVLHETEAWVFAAAQQLGEWFDDAALAENLRKQAEAAGGPELVNDGHDTAPSKRLLKARPSYNKTQDGPNAISDLGVPALRAACPHLDEWLHRIGF